MKKLKDYEYYRSDLYKWKHLDLFSGIGGFALAGLRVWGNDYECVGFCENNRFCQELLKKRFPEVKVYDDIKKLKGKQIIADARSQKPRGLSNSQWEKSKKIGNGDIDMLTGGFPCQPFSGAGKRNGKEDDRFLWPEMLRVIAEVKPKWVIGENVRGITNIERGMVLKQVRLDLENIGYEVEMFIIPAVAVNAPHRRDRVWIIAHAGQQYGEGKSQQGKFKNPIKQGGAVESERPVERDRVGVTSDTEHNGYKARCEKTRGEKRESKKGGMCEFTGKNSVATDTDIRRQKEQKQQTTGDKQRDRGDAADTKRTGQSGSFNGQRKEQFWGSNSGKNWYEVATELCGVDNGLSAELVGFKLSKARHRVERLKALGNAIVPQVAQEIMQAIKIAEGSRGQ